MIAKIKELEIGNEYYRKILERNELKINNHEHNS